MTVATNPTTAQLVVVFYVRATPEQVWQAMTVPAFTTQYYYGSPVDSTWQPGATVAYLTQDRSARMAEGTIVSVEPNRRLEITLKLVYAPHLAAETPSREVWEITDMHGVCKLTVSHSGMAPDSATIGAIKEGMPFILSSLKSLLETGSGLPVSEA